MEHESIELCRMPTADREDKGEGYLLQMKQFFYRGDSDCLLRRCLMAELRIECFTGNRVKPHIPLLARLRIEVFRDFPYLYDGSMAYEQKYLATYTASPECVVVVVFDGEEVVGASTGVPLAHEMPEVQRPFIEGGFDPERIFYCGESVLRKSYRGQGVGARFFMEREAHAITLRRFDTIAFCAVERPPGHPRQPPGYVPLDEFWRRRGFRKHLHLRTTISWKELDEEVESEKPMVFWLKPLPGKRGAGL